VTRTGTRFRWRWFLWTLAITLAAAAGLSAWTARWVSRPIATLLEGTLTPDTDRSAPIDIKDVPMVVAVEVGQVLRPVRDRVASKVTVYLVREHATATAPAVEPLLEMDHEFSRTAESESMTFTMHATIPEPGRYRLELARLELPFPGAATPVQVRVDRVRGSATPFEAGALLLSVLAGVTGLVAVVTSAVMFVARIRREDETA